MVSAFDSHCMVQWSQSLLWPVGNIFVIIALGSLLLTRPCPLTGPRNLHRNKVETWKICGINVLCINADLAISINQIINATHNWDRASYQFVSEKVRVRMIFHVAFENIGYHPHPHPLHPCAENLGYCCKWYIMTYWYKYFYFSYWMVVRLYHMSSDMTIPSRQHKFGNCA